MNKQTNFLTPKEVAKILRINILTVYDYIRSDSLAAMQLGRSYRIRQIDLDSFILSHLKKRSFSQVHPDKKI